MIRPATRADLPAFHAVMMAAGMDARSSWNRTSVEGLEASLFAPAAGGFVAVNGEEVIGCVGFRPDGADTLTLNRLAVLPQHRGQGIGATLVRAVERRAAERGFGRVLLAVSQFNLEVVSFYGRLGYAQVNERYAFASPGSPVPVVLVKMVRGSREAGRRMGELRKSQVSEAVKAPLFPRPAHRAPRAQKKEYHDP